MCHAAEDFHLLHGVIEGIAQLNRAGFCVIIVNNQRCTAKGLLTEEELENLHLRVTDQLAKGGARLMAFVTALTNLSRPAFAGNQCLAWCWNRCGSVISSLRLPG
jgi:histidinol phosphatase-like enzyme